MFFYLKTIYTSASDLSSLFASKQPKKLLMRMISFWLTEWKSFLLKKVYLHIYISYIVCSKLPLKSGRVDSNKCSSEKYRNHQKSRKEQENINKQKNKNRNTISGVRLSHVWKACIIFPAFVKLKIFNTQEKYIYHQISFIIFCNKIPLNFEKSNY